MTKPFDPKKFRRGAPPATRYDEQIARLTGRKRQTDCIEDAVKGVVDNLATAKTAALVVYGEPQSGKTEMMICLTAKLLDKGHAVIVHLMNDSVDLLRQNRSRFIESGLTPPSKVLSDLPAHPGALPDKMVLFCKKNANDLDKLIIRLGQAKVTRVVVIDDEADYATPNSKVNARAMTRINELVGNLLGADGCYIGVTATPARLDLNNTFHNDTEKWVEFRPHREYTGQDAFFPIDRSAIGYRLQLLPSGPALPADAKDALLRFFVTVAYLNTVVNKSPENYSFLVHTSGKKDDHKTDRGVIDSVLGVLQDENHADYNTIVASVFQWANTLYPKADPDELTNYVIDYVGRTTPIVLNSNRDKSSGDNATIPTVPFTVIVGGNIVSRGVTFPNLLAMFFTRNVQQRLQQDTYIQRARMFGTRGDYLKHFELTIPTDLFADWQRCFVFHRLAVKTIKDNLGSPVWIGDPRISVAASASIDRNTVVLDKGEISWRMFNFSAALAGVIASGPGSVATLRALQAIVGPEALPAFLIEYIEYAIKGGSGGIAIHPVTSIAGYADPDVVKNIARKRGFMGTNQANDKKFPGVGHHVRIFHNNTQARVFYKAGVTFIQNQR
jgi:hypothetical protein